MLRLTAIVLTLSASIAPAGASGQSLVSGTLSGSVAAPDGSRASRVLVTLTAPSRTPQEIEVSASGEFRVAQLSPGLYTLRAEALGFRPVVAPNIRVRAGTTSRVEITVHPERPPVTAVDTIAVSLAESSTASARGIHLDGELLDAVSDATFSFQSAAGLAPGGDRSGGFHGLPGGMARSYMDGVPFRVAAHPRLRGTDSPAANLTTAGLGGLAVGHVAADLEVPGPAGVLTGASRQGTGGPEAFRFEGGWSGDALWSSDRLDFDAPALTSIWGDLRARFDVTPGRTTVFVQAEGYQVERPTPGRLTTAEAGQLPGSGAADFYAGPGVDRTLRAAGHVRLDQRLDSGGRVQIRLDGGRLERTFEGPGPNALAYGWGLPAESTDFQASGIFVNPVSDAWAVEIKAGGSRSESLFGGREEAPAPIPTRFVGSGLAIGLPGGAEGEVTRTDIFVGSAAHYAGPSQTLKLGLSARSSRVQTSYGVGAPGEFFFTEPSGVTTGAGAFTSLGGSATSEPRTTEIGVYAQHRWTLGSDLQLLSGLRWDLEAVPTDDVESNEAWLEATGLDSAGEALSLSQFGGLLGLDWRVDGAGRTVLSVLASVQQGDLDSGMVHELLTLDGSTSVMRAVGAVTGWPEAPSGGVSRSLLALTGSDARAPRSAEISATLRQDLSRGFVLSLGGVLRRSDFFQRRRDLNLTATPARLAADGRPVYGELAQVGSVVQAVPGSSRRFDGFDMVWALDTDGWSEYRAVSAGLEYGGAAGAVFATYTRSETTDNWVGAAAGHPGSELRPSVPARDWDEALSDFDAPHGVTVGGFLRADLLGGLTLGGAYRYRSGLPFTPGYRAGVDVNGDLSGRNDPAAVPASAGLGALASDWPCLAEQAGGIAERNSCRGPDRQSLELKLRLGITPAISLEVAGFDVIESDAGLVDSALLLVDPQGTIQHGADGSVTLPTRVNPDFGAILIPESTGRLLRVGLRIGVGG